MITPSPIGLGCYPLGGGYGAVSDETARATLRAAADFGWTFVDTAESYLDSEERLGTILAGSRERVFLATKAFPSEPFTRSSLLAAADASLRRLRTEWIDLYQLHGPESWMLRPPFTPMDEVAEALGDLRAAGKIREVGVCNFPVDDIAELNQYIHLYSMQDLYGIVDPGEDEDLPNLPSVGKKLRFAQDNDIGFIAYSPLARGLLNDNAQLDRQFTKDDERYYLPRYQPGVYEHYVHLAHRLSTWAQERGHTLRQLAVAWALHHPAVRSVLVGAKSPQQIEAIAGAENWALNDLELAEIAQICDDSLPPAARAALVTVWDHFPPEALERLRRRRYQPTNTGTVA